MFRKLISILSLFGVCINFSVFGITYSSGQHTITTPVNDSITVENAGTEVTFNNTTFTSTNTALNLLYTRNGAVVNLNHMTVEDPIGLISALMDISNATVNIDNTTITMRSTTTVSVMHIHGTVNIDNTTISNLNNNASILKFSGSAVTKITAKNSTFEFNIKAFEGNAESLTFDNVTIVQHVFNPSYSALALGSTPNITIDNSTITGGLSLSYAITDPVKISISNTTFNGKIGTNTEFNGLLFSVPSATDNEVNISNTTLTDFTVGIDLTFSQSAVLTADKLTITAQNPIKIAGKITGEIKDSTLNVSGPLGAGGNDGKGIGLYMYNVDSVLQYKNGNVVHLKDDNEIGILVRGGTVYVGADNDSVNTVTKATGKTPKAAVWVGPHPNVPGTVLSLAAVHILGMLNAAGMDVVAAKGGKLYLGSPSDISAHIKGNVVIQADADPLRVYTGGAIDYSAAVGAIGGMVGVTDPSNSSLPYGTVIDGNVENYNTVNVYSSASHKTLFLITGNMNNYAGSKIDFKEDQNLVHMVIGGNLTTDNTDLVYEINPNVATADYLWIGGNFTGTYKIHVHFTSDDKLLNPVQLFHVKGTLEKKAKFQTYNESVFTTVAINFDQDTIFKSVNDPTKTYTFKAKNYYLIVVETNAENKFCTNINGEKYCAVKQELPKEILTNANNTPNTVIVVTEKGYVINARYYQPVTVNTGILMHMLNQFLIADHTTNYLKLPQNIHMGIYYGTMDWETKLHTYSVNLLYTFPSFENPWLFHSYTKIFAYGAINIHDKENMYGNMYMYLVGMDVNKTVGNIGGGGRLFGGYTHSKINIMIEDPADLLNNWHTMNRGFIGTELSADYGRNVSENLNIRGGMRGVYMYLFPTKIDDKSVSNIDMTIEVQNLHMVEPEILGEAMYRLNDKFQWYVHGSVGYLITGKPEFKVNGLGYRQKDKAFNGVTYSIQTGIYYIKNIGVKLFYSGMPAMKEHVVGLTASISFHKFTQMYYNQ